MIHYFKTEAKVRTAIRKLKKLETVNYILGKHRAQLMVGQLNGGFFVLTYFASGGNINDEYWADQTIQEKAAQL